MPIKVLHISSSIGRESYGLGQVVVNLTKAQNDLGADARIWCLDPEEQVDWAIKLPGLARNKVRNYCRFSPAKLGFSQAMLSAARSDARDFHVVHQHGIWTACSHVSNTIRRIHRIPTVISPHGSLQEWALKRSLWKKRFALLVYERENLRRAACLHATAEAEVTAFRDYGLSNPIALISNGVSEFWLKSQGDGHNFRMQHGISFNRRLLLYMSRITPKKGLPILLEAINRIRNDFSDWLLIIAGADEFGHLQKIKSLVTNLNLQDLVLFTGPLFDQEKRDAFAASDAFVLPSYSEGAPMVVLDALATGVPVITTQGTPWQDLIIWRCGWWVEPSTNGIMQALQEMLKLSRDQLRLMGLDGQNLVKSQYLWKMQGLKALALYAWLLGTNGKPDFVIID